MHPDLVIKQLPAMRLIGYGAEAISLMHPDSNANDVAPEAWRRLFASPALQGMKFGWAVGAMWPADGAPADSGRMHYLAAVVVEEWPEDLADFETAVIEEGDYLVLEHQGDETTIPGATTRFYTELLPAADVQQRWAPHLEVYDERYQFGSADSITMICAPIVSR